MSDEVDAILTFDPDTEHPDQPRTFPPTLWSQLLERRGQGAAREGIEMLARRYWRPVYAYVRARWRRSNEDAKDLTQGFFAWVLDSDFLSRADPRRGRFRTFLIVALEHYLAKESRAARRLKRGGGASVVRLDEAGGAASVAGRAQPAPAATLDEAWRREIIEESAARLEDVLAREGKETCFLVFEDYFLAGDDDVDYAAVAARRGITRAAVSNHLMYAKRRFRAIATDLVAQTVAGPDELRAELAFLFGAPEAGPCDL